MLLFESLRHAITGVHPDLSCYCYYLLVRYVCSENDITSCHITCTCTCTCIPLAFLAPPTPCTPAHAHHSLIRALAHKHLPQVQCCAREVGSVDEGFQVSLLLRIDHMKSHTSLFHNSSCPSMVYYPASLVVCELLGRHNLSQAHRVVHQVGSHTTHHHHHITSSRLYTSPLYSLYFFSVYVTMDTMCLDPMCLGPGCFARQVQGIQTRATVDVLVYVCAYDGCAYDPFICVRNQL